jgi:hypothetical protein
LELQQNHGAIMILPNPPPTNHTLVEPIHNKLGLTQLCTKWFRGAYKLGFYSNFDIMLFYPSRCAKSVFLSFRFSILFSNGHNTMSLR